MLYFQALSHFLKLPVLLSPELGFEPKGDNSRRPIMNLDFRRNKNSPPESQAVVGPSSSPLFQNPQYSKQGQAWAPLQLSVSWDCAVDATRVCVDYSYNGEALGTAVTLSNVQILLPIEEPAANVQPQPKACWNLEEKRLLWQLLDVPGTQGRGGSGRLLASWEPLNGPSKPSPVAAQFTSEGSTVSGADVELVGSGYRMSLVKKRFATGIYIAGS
ncbi:F-BAR domain only protein 1-like [Sceloporus undulatus]|uniref:F-BAR domain only protein 1-like n=1 Tax=Sceloporus undulatus TaxID=8520 RepID=UPI001C4DB055|nr:F-BAR domain only protein 1-like [Sceloporus undulatus]